MDLGYRVVRGQDWEWDDQDGGEGCVGTVVQGVEDEADAIEGTAWVQWDTGALANYRAGLDRKVDLRVYDSGGTGKAGNVKI
jgi:E3 ubiquitin-protein ligase mind-bomb